jgi:hypothetical protein
MAAAAGKVTADINRDKILMFVEQIGLVLIGLCTLIWLALARSWNARFLWKRGTGDEPTITALYKQMIRYLSGRGIPKHAAMTPLELTRMTQDRWADAASAVATITEIYCRGRFSRTPLTREEIRSAQDHLRHLMALGRS